MQNIILRWFGPIWVHVVQLEVDFGSFSVLFQGFGHPGRPRWPRAGRAAPKQSQGEDLEDFIRNWKSLGGFYKENEKIPEAFNRIY